MYSLTKIFLDLFLPLGRQSSVGLRLKANPTDAGYTRMVDDGKDARGSANQLFAGTVKSYGW